jgi:hypothetical protein
MGILDSRRRRMPTAIEFSKRAIGKLLASVRSSVGVDSSIVRDAEQP